MISYIAPFGNRNYKKLTASEMMHYYQVELVVIFRLVTI